MDLREKKPHTILGMRILGSHVGPVPKAGGWIFWHRNANKQASWTGGTESSGPRGYDVMRFCSMGWPALHHLSPPMRCSCFIKKKRRGEEEKSHSAQRCYSLYAKSLIIFFLGPSLHPNMYSSSSFPHLSLPCQTVGPRSLFSRPAPSFFFFVFITKEEGKKNHSFKNKDVTIFLLTGVGRALNYT